MFLIKEMVGGTGVKESRALQNHRVACVGKDFKIIQFQLLAMGSGCPGGDTAEVTDVTLKQQSMMDTFQYLSEM